MEKIQFINLIDNQTNKLFNEKNLWGIVYDYLPKCFVCDKIFDNTKKKTYMINDKEICFFCLINNKEKN